MADHAIGLPPLNSVLARDMIGRTTVARLLSGYRNIAGADLDAIATVLMRLSDLVMRVPEISELDINPLLADDDGVLALDARVALAPAIRQTAIAAYPHALERHVIVRDGREMMFRPIRPEDEKALTAMIANCTPADLHLRFFNAIKTLPHEMAARLSQIDYDREMAFVAVEPSTVYGEGPIFGVARIICDPENEAAEFAVIVRSDMQGRGLGYGLMSAIIEYGRARGLTRVYGNILEENDRMLRMVRELGFATVFGAGADAVRATLELG